VRRAIVVAVVAVFAFAVACLRTVSYECNNDTFCQHAGMQGTCEADKFCSYSDPACASGKRYGADGPMAGECVGGGSGSGSGSGSFTIGGSAIGVAGSGLSLADNGTDMLAVGSNGPFTFAQTVAGGSNYLVTVLASPTRELCKVTNGSGTATANVTNVVATCASGSGGIMCGSAAVCMNSQVCCHGKSDATGSCQSDSGSCNGNQQPQECDDCTGTQICCAHLTSTGTIKATIQCVNATGNCTATGTDTVQYLCDPNAATPCPGTMTCTFDAMHAWFRCQ